MFSKEMNTFIQQGYIQSIKIDHKDISNVTQIIFCVFLLNIFK